jgi:predicted transcriptional regulator
MGDLLSILTSSEKRKRLVLLLTTGPKNWEEIKEVLDVSATGMLPQIRILEEKHLIRQEDRIYSLTEMGTVLASYLAPLVSTADALEEQYKFWCEHDITAIPMPLLTKIGELRDTRIIEGQIENIYEPHREFLENILLSKRVCGISPLVHPMYPRFFLELAKNGMEISLILTKKAYEKIQNDYELLLREGLGCTNASLYVFDGQVRLAFIVTDRYFSLSLFLKNGIFDAKSDLISANPSARRWGEELFTYFQKQSVKIGGEGPS